MALFPFAACVPFSNNVPLQDAAGRERHGVLFRAAGHEAPPAELVQRLEQLLGLTGSETLRYADRRRGQHRAVRLQRVGNEARLEAFLLSGDTRAEAWIKAVLQDELPAQAYGRLLLAPGAKPPLAVQQRGKLVCSCFNVAAPAIEHHLAASTGDATQRLVSLQDKLRCGTNCGSCVPELKRLVRAILPVPKAA
jgi:assimilatory nitrate reductase catalytic subunit